MKDWEKDLNEAIKGAFKNNEKKVEDKNKRLWVLSTLAALVAILFCITFEYKNPGIITNLIDTKVSKVTPEQKLSKEQVAVYKLLVDLNRRIVQLETKNDPRVKELQDRVRLLAILHNENWAITKHILRNNLSNYNYIFFDKEWKINDMPKNLILNEEDREFLEKNLKG